MSAPTRVLFVTSNGTGLGHLTRSLAIASRLGPGVEPLFITLSAAAPVVAALGRPVEYLASYDRPGAGNDLSWTLRTRERLRVAVTEAEPDVVMFDGTHPYERLLPALRASGAPLVWCRRALWRAGADTAPLHRSHLFDAILEPGEIGAGGERGPTAARRGEAHVVDPIVLVGREQLLPREDAERELGLEPGRRNVLVALGQGAGVREGAARALRRLAARPEVQVAALSSALAESAEGPADVVPVRARYPIARLYSAFDAVISAAGYNQVHELAALGIPALLVPMQRDTDDQAARAREAQEAGAALAVAGVDDPALEERLDELVDPSCLEGLRAGAEGLGDWEGAAQAARFLLERAALPPGPASPASRPSPAVRARRAWIFASTVPRTVARITRQTLSRPASRVHVMALGLPAERHRAELERALGSLADPPDEVLVVTDRLEFEPLLRAGVAFEHVPAEDSVQAALAGVPYAEFRAARLALIRARRPRPRRVVELR